MTLDFVTGGHRGRMKHPYDLAFCGLTRYYYDLQESINWVFPIYDDEDKRRRPKKEWDSRPKPASIKPK